MPASQSKPRVVAFIESASAMGGVQFSTLYLAQSLDRANWRPVVICPDEGDLTHACREAGVENQILEQPRFRSTSVRIGPHSARLPNPAVWVWNGFAMFIIARRLVSLLKRLEPDLVVTKGLSSHFYGGLAARRLCIPCVWHLQDFISERFWKIYQRFFGQVARWLPDHIIVDGASITRQLHHSVQDRISIIHNGVDTKVFRPDENGQPARREFEIPLDAIVIGHVGRMTPWKGQHYLLEAFARIAPIIENVYLLFVGAPVFDNDAYQRELVNQTSRLGLTERVKFAGYRHDLPFLLAAMDVFAFTSVEKDTSPLALLSAMASGLPIVAFDIEGVRELLPPNEQFLVPSGQIERLAESIMKLLSDGALRRQLAAYARQRAEANLSLEQYVSRMQESFLKAGRNTSRISSETKVELFQA